MCSLLSDNCSLQLVSKYCTEISQAEYVRSLITLTIRDSSKYYAFMKEQHLKTENKKSGIWPFDCSESEVTYDTKAVVKKKCTWFKLQIHNRCHLWVLQCATLRLPRNVPVFGSVCVCSEIAPWRQNCNRKHFVDCGLFWISLVALLPRQQQLEKTRLPSREQLCFCSNQGYGEGSGFTWFSHEIFVIGLDIRRHWAHFSNALCMFALKR